MLTQFLASGQSISHGFCHTLKVNVSVSGVNLKDVAGGCSLALVRAWDVHKLQKELLTKLYRLESQKYAI
jgi:hypothetical protein